MPVVNWVGNQEKPDQAWLAGGIQLISDTSNPNGRLDHIAIITENLEKAVHEAVIRGAMIFQKGPSWIELPDGLVIELIQQAGSEVDDFLNVKVSYVP
ncbi:VOC family protein [Sporosarcina sp. 179-K 3D1 HS]|uniref:VOC family protein n=1 Tax=Sporosarcina sp. 179-K 3D1 HS TaxID=3232169 RepID=UPI00399EEA90